MYFYVNEIFQEQSTDNKYRILWIDHDNVILYAIELDNPKAFPLKKLVSELREAIVIGDWIKLKDDEFIPVVSKDYEIKHYEARDMAWKTIKSIVGNEPYVYEKSFRIKFIREACEKYNISYPAIRKYLYKYWSRGKTVDALLPDYKNSGARGKERSSKDKKRGRPSKYSIEGINVDEETKKIFRVALEKYYLTSKQNKMTDAYK